jgi:hypothetical protein
MSEEVKMQNRILMLATCKSTVVPTAERCLGWVQ